MRYFTLSLLLIISSLHLFAADGVLRTLSGRTAFQRGEVISFTVQIPLTEAAKHADISLLLDDSGVQCQIASDSAEQLAAGTFARNYHLNSGRLKVGNYRLLLKFTAGENIQQLNMPLEIVSNTRKTDFVIPHINFQPWFFPPKMSAAAAYQRYHFNFSLANIVDFWNRQDKPELTGGELAAEDLLRYGIDFLKYPTGYGWGLSHAPIRGGASWRDPDVIDISAQLMQYHTQGARRFPNFIGMNPIDEPVVPWSDKFMAAEYTRLTGSEPPKQNEQAANPASVSRYQQYRNQVLELFDAEMKADMRQVAPTAAMANQTFADILTDSGLYPSSHVSLDIQSTHIYDHWPTSNNWMSFDVNLRRANRPIFADRPLWVYSGCYGIVEDQWRASWSLALSEKVDGHGYFLGAGEMSPGLPWVEYSVAEMVRINRLNEKYGNFLLKLQKPLAPLALWYSLAQAGASPAQRAYEQQVVGAYYALKRAHFPVTIITDEDVRAGLLSQHKVLMLIDAHYLPADLTTAVASFQIAGGKILVDDQSTLKLPKQQIMPVNFREFAATQQEIGNAWTENQPVSMRLRRDIFSDESIIRQLPAVIDALTPLVARPALANSSNTFLTIQQYDKASFLFIANEASVYEHPNIGLNWITMQESIPAMETITMPFAQNKAIYDILTGERLYLDKELKINLRLPMGGLRILGIYPKALGELALKAIISGNPRQLQAAVSGSVGGIIPAELTISDAEGNIKQQQYVALDPLKATNQWNYLIGDNDLPGEWQISLRNLISGKVAIQTVSVAQPVAAPGIINTVSDITTYDERMYRNMLQSPGLLIVPGSGTEDLAQSLARSLNGKIKASNELLKADIYPDILDPEKNKGIWMMPRPAPLNMTAGANLLLLGTPENNSVIKQLNTSGILPQPIYKATLGPGQGLIQYVWSPFDRGKDAVIISAIDNNGLSKACERFLSIARGDKIIRDETIPLAASLAVSGERFTALAEIANIIPLQHIKLADSIRKMAAGNNTIATAGEDSYLTIFDMQGKELWRKDLGYRVIGVAVSKDGQFIAAGAFPRSYLFDRQGNLLYYKSADVPSQDDPEGLTVIAGAGNDKTTLRMLSGSWSGRVQGFSALGNRLWSFPATPKDKNEPTPAPLSPIRTIALLDNGNIAVGAMQELVILDQQGTEINRQKFDRIQSLAAIENGLILSTFMRKIIRLDAAGATIWQQETPDFIMASAVSPDGKKIAAALFSGEVIIYDDAGKIVKHAAIADTTLTGIVFSTNSSALWLSSWDGDLWNWKF